MFRYELPFYIPFKKFSCTNFVKRFLLSESNDPLDVARPKGC